MEQAIDNPLVIVECVPPTIEGNLRIHKFKKMEFGGIMYAFITVYAQCGIVQRGTLCFLSSTNSWRREDSHCVACKVR